MSTISGQEADMLEQIALGTMVEQVLGWAAINSGTGNLPGLADMAGKLADAFSVLPGTLELVEAAPVERVGANGQTEPVACGRHLVLRVRPEVDRRILLTGHMDTVYAVDHPFQHCDWIDDTILHGPGTADMKGGIALMLAGLQAFEATNPSIGYDVLINSDEETGSRSSADLIKELVRGKEAALTYEPSLPGGIMARARPGSGNFSAIVTGRSAHAGRNPDDGRNAIVAASDLAIRLTAGRHQALSVNPSRMDGGGPDNMVPDHAILRFNMRPSTPADAEQASALIAYAVAEVSRIHDVVIHVHGGFGRPPKPITPASEHLFALIRQAAADLDEKLEWQDTGGVCDGNNIAAANVPVIDTMGACGGDIHSPSEYLLVSSLVPRARLTALTLHRLNMRGMEP